MKTLQLPVPTEIQKIVDTLAQKYEVYYVGGCVRDFLLGKEIDDYDCATNATPEQMKEILSEFKIIETGKKHGTLTIIYQSKRVEITTFRSETVYRNHRLPEHVTFVHSIHEDLKRRDFTINAMALTPQGHLIDDHHGLEDLKHHIIRCVGNPAHRFEEDALRILRALRFSYILNFDIEEETEEALYIKKALLDRISAERKTNELYKMLKEDSHNILRFLDNHEVLPYYGIGYHSFIDERLNHCVNDLECKLACLFFKESHARKVLRQWHCANKKIEHVVSLIRERNIENEDEPIKIRRILYEYQQNPNLIKKIFTYLKIDSYHSIVSQQDYFTKLAINGNDIKTFGFSGTSIKKVLDECLQLCYENPQMNQRKTLLQYIEKKYKQ